MYSSVPLHTTGAARPTALGARVCDLLVCRIGLISAAQRSPRRGKWAAAHKPREDISRAGGDRIAGVAQPAKVGGHLALLRPEGADVLACRIELERGAAPLKVLRAGEKELEGELGVIAMEAKPGLAAFCRLIPVHAAATAHAWGGWWQSPARRRRRYACHGR